MYDCLLVVTSYDRVQVHCCASSCPGAFMMPIVPGFGCPSWLSGF